MLCACLCKVFTIDRGMRVTPEWRLVGFAVGRPMFNFGKRPYIEYFLIKKYYCHCNNHLFRSGTPTTTARLIISEKTLGGILLLLDILFTNNVNNVQKYINIYSGSSLSQKYWSLFEDGVENSLWTINKLIVSTRLLVTL